MVDSLFHEAASLPLSKGVSSMLQTRARTWSSIPQFPCAPVGEVGLLGGQGDALDLAAEAAVGHDHGAATAAAGVDERVVAPDGAEVVHEELGLRRFQPVQFGDQLLLVLAVAGVAERGVVHVPDAVVVVVQPVHVAEPEVDRSWPPIPVAGDVPLVGVAGAGTNTEASRRAAEVVSVRHR